MIAAEAEITPRLHNAANYRTNCFELFGLDVILDSSLEPHLLEVNISPSLMGSSPLDKKIKGMLVADILHVSALVLIVLSDYLYAMLVGGGNVSS
jgi:tubulin polyglutamylase TTLL4